MADKSASVKISADPRGFIAGMKATEAVAKQTGAKIESSLAGAATSAGRKMRDSTGKFLKQGAEDGARGMLNALQDVEAKSKSIFQRMGEAAKKAFSGVAKFGSGFLKGAGIDRKESSAETLGKYGASALQAASAIGVKAVSDANRVLEKATRVSIGARGAGEQGVDPKMLAAEWFAITQDVKGVTADALGDAAAKYVGMTGDLKTARSSMRDFAIAAQASGANVEDVAGTAAAISQQFGITDPAQIREVLGSLIGQGKSGAFELKDAASLFPGLAAAGASFGLGKGVAGVKTLGGIVQIARTGTGSGEMAATNVNAMLTALKTNADKLQLAGTKVYEGTGANKKTRDLPTIIAEMIAKTGGTDLAKKNAGLTEILTATGFKAIAPLVTQYQDMFKQSSGKTDAARQADAQERLLESIRGSIDAAGSWADTVQDAATAGSTSSARMTAAWERLTGGVASRVLPKLLAMAEKLTSADGAIELFVSGLGLAVSAVEQLKDFVDAVTGNNKDKSVASYHTNEAARERARAEGLRQELKAFAPGVGEDDFLGAAKFAGGDKEKLAKVRDLQNKIALAEGTASFEEKQARTVNGIVQPPAAPPGSGTAPVVKAEFAPKGIIDVRVTNQPGTAAPAPGYLPRP